MNNKVSKLQKWQVLHYQPEMLNELLCIPEVSITQLTVGVIGHHVHLPLLLLKCVPQNWHFGWSSAMCALSS